MTDEITLALDELKPARDAVRYDAKAAAWEKLRAHLQWNPASEPPGDNAVVLVCYDDEQIAVAWYHSGDWLEMRGDSSDGEHFFEGLVSHWRELPDSPVGDSDD